MLSFPVFVRSIKPVDRGFQLVPLLSGLDGVVHLVGRDPFFINDLVEAFEDCHDCSGVLLDLGGAVLIVPAASLKISADHRAKQSRRRNETDDRADDRSRPGSCSGRHAIVFGGGSICVTVAFWPSHPRILDSPALTTGPPARRPLLRVAAYPGKRCRRRPNGRRDMARRSR